MSIYEMFPNFPPTPKPSNGYGSIWNGATWTGNASTVTFVPIVRSEVWSFAQEMERVLKVNDWKGGWKQCSREFILHKLEEEYHELRAAILTDKGPFKILQEAADLANVSMFAADLFGGLNATSN